MFCTLWYTNIAIMEYPHVQYFFNRKYIFNSGPVSSQLCQLIPECTPIYKPFSPFGRGITLHRELTITMVINHLQVLGWSSKYPSFCWVVNSYSSSLRHSEPSEELDVPEEDGISHIFSCAPWEVQGVIPTKSPTPPKLRRYVDHQNLPKTPNLRSYVGCLAGLLTTIIGLISSGKVALGVCASWIHRDSSGLNSIHADSWSLWRSFVLDV